MNMQVLPQRRTIIPDSAPFTPEQQAWLNGFFEAILSAPAEGAAVEVIAPGAASPESAVALADNDSAPWHDPSLPIDERLTLAAGKPLAPRLMAAMAQQDCGQMRLQLRRLRQRPVPEEGGASDALRAGRQGNRAHAEAARAGNRAGDGRGSGRREGA
jgi:hypothetical protein